MKTKNQTELQSHPLYPQGSLICPICGKEFEANDDTRYIIAGGFTCSWKCFLTESKRRRETRQEEDQPKRGGRKSKNV